MEEQDKQDKLDQKDDLQVTENGSNDGDDQRGDQVARRRSTKRRTGKETSTQRSRGKPTWRASE